MKAFIDLGWLQKLKTNHPHIIYNFKLLYKSLFISLFVTEIDEHGDKHLSI